jgi:hypothetical protein
MAKRKVINMETGEGIEGESPQDVLTPKLGVKRIGRVKPVETPLEVDPGLRPKPELEPESKSKSKPESDPGPTLIKEITVEAPQPAFEQVKIVCLRPSRRNEIGRITKNKYVFENGEPVLVDVRDVGYMRATHRGSRTCGVGDTRVFVELTEL